MTVSRGRKQVIIIITYSSEDMDQIDAYGVFFSGTARKTSSYEKYELPGIGDSMI